MTPRTLPRLLNRYGFDVLDIRSVGVARSVHEVDGGVAVHDSRVLCSDGDAALALEIAGVEDARDNLLVVAEDVGLSEHAVDQRRLAVIDVGDDGDVADVGG